jgi:hypothetical protein
MVQAPLTDDRDVHLLVIVRLDGSISIHFKADACMLYQIHGLWGSSQHVSQIEETIQNHFDKNQDSYDHQLRVCLHASCLHRSDSVP